MKKKKKTKTSLSEPPTFPVYYVLWFIDSKENTVASVYCMSINNAEIDNQKSTHLHLSYRNNGKFFSAHRERGMNWALSMTSRASEESNEGC